MRSLLPHYPEELAKGMLSLTVRTSLAEITSSPFRDEIFFASPSRTVGKNDVISEILSGDNFFPF
jgi:hypothetical protein